MPPTVVPHPVSLTWGDFATVAHLSNHEDAHVNPVFELQNRPLRRVGRDYALAETFEVRVRPLARVRQGASQTDDLLAHEQGHYDIGIVAARALSRDLAALRASSPRALVHAADTAWTLHTQTRLGAIQQAYDTDTNHSRDAQAQQRWAELIRAALALASPTDLNRLPV